LAAWLAKSKTGVQTVKKGLLPFLIILGIVSVLMVLQPDIDTLVIMFAAGVAMYFVSGARWRHLAIICLIIVMGITAVGFYKPYIVARVRVGDRPWYFNRDDSESNFRVGKFGFQTFIE
jgi:cell division protein FtsW